MGASVMGRPTIPCRRCSPDEPQPELKCPVSYLRHEP